MSMAGEPGWHRGDWMQTYTGRRFYPTAPAADDVDIIDIAHALGMLCRYAGHVDRFYSVAEHCVLMSRAVPRALALEALLHDATEAYTVDVPRPLKVQLPDYQAAEARVAIAIAEHFGHQRIEGGQIVEHPDVKAADTRILLDERTALMAAYSPSNRWGVDSLTPLGVNVEGWMPAEAERRYLDRFFELTAPACDCGSVDKYGDDIGEHGPRCPYHLAAVALFGELKV